MATAAVMAEETGLTVADPDAVAVFYEQTLPRIYGYFLRRCGGVAAVAEDLSQETYLAAIRELKRRGTVDTPIPWLYGIARHKLLDYYRGRGRTTGQVVPWDDGLDQDVVLPAMDPAAAETDARLSRALARLPDGQRAAIVLRYLDGLPVPAVAALIGKSVHATESLLARGRASLRRALADPND